MNCGLGNLIFPFKSRKINLENKIQIYRNLTNKNAKYSIRQKYLVVGHTNQIMLHTCKFKVSKLGRQKVLKTKQKNVHAFIEGIISKKGGMGMTPADQNTLPAIITYNPYENSAFRCSNLTTKPFNVYGAMCVIINKNGVSAAYVD